MAPAPSSLYPPTNPPKNNKVLIRVPGDGLTLTDRALVTASSLLVVGSVFWVPAFYAWVLKKWKSIPKSDSRRRAVYGALLIAVAGVAVTGPHRSKRVGEFLQFRKWKLWKAWLKFVAFEVIQSGGANTTNHTGESAICGGGSKHTFSPPQKFDMKNDQAILAFVPHGIFPFALGFATLTEEGEQAFGGFRPVVATATSLVPILRTLISWFHPVDASRSAVDRALSLGARIGLAPGGIAEMFEGYPKPMTHPNDECAILNSRKGFIKMAIKHGVPVIPIYCFGATKMFKRLQFPLLEHLSNILRVSICLFFGRWGLPVPLRQRLLYVMGEPIFPPLGGEVNLVVEGSEEFSRQVDEMHKTFCDELVTLFDRNKESYGWDRKMLRIV